MQSTNKDGRQKQLLFTLTAKDFEWDYFRCGGNGGQNVNKVSSGVRCTHLPSGAVVRVCDTRSQLENRRIAFRRITETDEFKAWHKIEVVKRSGVKVKEVDPRTIDERVDEQMIDKNLKIEYISSDSDTVTVC